VQQSHHTLERFEVVASISIIAARTDAVRTALNSMPIRY
jgi:hypothetical protein